MAQQKEKRDASSRGRSEMQGNDNPTKRAGGRQASGQQRGKTGSKSGNARKGTESGGSGKGGSRR